MIGLKRSVIIAIASVLLEFCVLFGIILFQQNILMSFPLAARAVLMIALQWLLLIVPFVLMKKENEMLSDLGFSTSKIGLQILTGVFVALAMSLVLTVLPIIAGFKHMVGSNSYTQLWQFCFQFVYMIFGVALVEEFFYRGFLFKKLLDIRHSRWFAIALSSAVFGMSHIFSGNIIQVINTSILGIIFCICREKIKNCTTLSLIIAHGIHNALITLFVAIL